jgi:hypothetical protein
MHEPSPDDDCEDTPPTSEPINAQCAAVKQLQTLQEIVDAAVGEIERLLEE